MGKYTSARKRLRCLCINCGKVHECYRSQLQAARLSCEDCGGNVVEAKFAPNATPKKQRRPRIDTNHWCYDINSITSLETLNIVAAKVQKLCESGEIPQKYHQQLAAAVERRHKRITSYNNCLERRRRKAERELTNGR